MKPHRNKPRVVRKVGTVMVVYLLTLIMALGSVVAPQTKVQANVAKMMPHVAKNLPKWTPIAVTAAGIAGMIVKECGVNIRQDCFLKAKRVFMAQFRISEDQWHDHVLGWYDLCRNVSYFTAFFVQVEKHCGNILKAVQLDQPPSTNITPPWLQPSKNPNPNPKRPTTKPGLVPLTKSNDSLFQQVFTLYPCTTKQCATKREQLYRELAKLYQQLNNPIKFWDTCKQQKQTITITLPKDTCTAESWLGKGINQFTPQKTNDQNKRYGVRAQGNSSSAGGQPTQNTATTTSKTSPGEYKRRLIEKLKKEAASEANPRRAALLNQALERLEKMMNPSWSDLENWMKSVLTEGVGVSKKSDQGYDEVRKMSTNNIAQARKKNFEYLSPENFVANLSIVYDFYLTPNASISKGSQLSSLRSMPPFQSTSFPWRTTGTPRVTNNSNPVKPTQKRPFQTTPITNQEQKLKNTLMGQYQQAVSPSQSPQEQRARNLDRYSELHRDKLPDGYVSLTQGDITSSRERYQYQTNQVMTEIEPILKEWIKKGNIDSYKLYKGETLYYEITIKKWKYYIFILPIKNAEELFVGSRSSVESELHRNKGKLKFFTSPQNAMESLFVEDGEKPLDVMDRAKMKK